MKVSLQQIIETLREVGLAPGTEVVTSAGGTGHGVARAAAAAGRRSRTKMSTVAIGRRAKGAVPGTEEVAGATRGGIIEAAAVERAVTHRDEGAPQIGTGEGVTVGDATCQV